MLPAYQLPPAVQARAGRAMAESPEGGAPPRRGELRQTYSPAFLEMSMCGKAVANKVLLLVMRQTARTQGGRERNELFSGTLGRKVTSEQCVPAHPLARCQWPM